MLTVAESEKRQQRLREIMADRRIDLAVVTDHRHVIYLTGRVSKVDQPSVLLLPVKGERVLIGPTSAHPAACDRELTYPTFSITVLVDDLAADAARLLDQAMREVPAPLRVFVEPSAMSARIADVLRSTVAQSTWVDLRPTMLELRRRKDPDEIECIRESIRVAEAGYAAARNTIAVGRTELDVHAAMYDAMVHELGSSFVFDGDFATGQRADKGGGPPTRRAIEPNDLYILDIFPRINGYACDLCRTFAVDKPTATQRDAWNLVHGTLDEVAKMIRPGVTGGEVRAEMERRLHAIDLARDSFFHHAGHGIGLQPHESPRMIVDCDHTFEIGNVFTLEPGIYGPHLQGGIRLEHNYLLGPSGPEQLDTFPMDLT